MQNAAASMMMGRGAPRAFTIAPAVSGKSTWDLDQDGPLNLAAAGTWTITPLADFEAPAKAWGAGALDGGAGLGGVGGGALGVVTLREGVEYRLYVGSPSGAPGGGAPASATYPATWGAGYSGLRTAAGAGKLIAGGGGGAGWGGNGGPGGGLAGGPGVTGGPLGGSQTTGTPWQGQAGGTYSGPEGTGGGGPGGGGYRGGGGSSSTAGGGGGSGFADPADVADAELFTGSAANLNQPGNAADPDRGASGQRGQAGRVILY